MAKMTDAQIRNAPPRSRQIADGSVTGLWFFPGSQKGRGNWILKYTSKETKARREMGLGTYPEIRIEDARRLAAAARSMNANGIDPINHRKSERERELNIKAVPEKTFEEAARATYQEKLQRWSNAKHSKQWISSLERYVFPKLGIQPVASLKPADFADCLREIWNDIPETASRVRQRCFDVMKWCRAHELIEANPVELVEHILGKQLPKRERERHQPAMNWREIPNFLKTHLRTGDEVSRLGLEFLILTAVRSGELRGATWSEFDFEKKVWTIPAERMKKKKRHSIPLAERPMEILRLQKLRNDGSDLVFPSPRGKMLSDMAFTSFLRKHKIMSSDGQSVATAHGFRSSFRDWASENGYSRDLAEKALAHELKDKTEKAYHRTDLLKERVPMMQAWATLVCSQVE